MAWRSNFRLHCDVRSLSASRRNRRGFLGRDAASEEEGDTMRQCSRGRFVRSLAGGPGGALLALGSFAFAAESTSDGL